MSASYKTLDTILTSSMDDNKKHSRTQPNSQVGPHTTPLVCAHFFGMHNHGTIAHARAQTTTIARKSGKQNTTSRVQLEEAVSAAARTLAIPQSLAERDPARCTSDAA